MRKIKGGYFTNEPTPQLALNPLSSISSTDATELTTSCSINDIMKAFDNNPDSIDINNFSYTPNVTNAPQLEGREALVEMLKEVINDTDIYNTDNETSSIITQPPMQTGAGKYKRIIKKVIKKIKKNIKPKTAKTKPKPKTKTTKPTKPKPKTAKTKPKTTKPKTKTTKPKTKTKTTKPKTKTTKPKTKTTKPKTTKPKMKSCNCKK